MKQVALTGYVLILAVLQCHALINASEAQVIISDVAKEGSQMREEQTFPKIKLASQSKQPNAVTLAQTPPNQLANMSVYYQNNPRIPGPNLEYSEIPVYTNSTLSSQFNRNTWNRDCCSSPDLFNQIYNSSAQTSLDIRNLNNTAPLWLTQFSIRSEFTTGLETQLRAPPDSESLIQIPPNKSTHLNIDILCKGDYNANNYWAGIIIDLTFALSPAVDAPIQTVSMYYFFVCDEKFRPVKYAFNLGLLTIVLVIFVYFIAITTTPCSIICSDTFKRFEVKWYHAWIYMVCVLLMAVLNQVLDAKLLQKIMNISIGIICGIAAWFFTSEIQCMSKVYHAKVKRVLFKVGIFSFQILDIISATVAGALVFFWAITGKAWYSSDLLALCLLGSLMRLLKFKAFKQGFTFLLICLLVDSIGGSIVYLSQALSYDTIFINDYNEPFLIAVPIYRMLYDKSCSWLPVTGTAFPSLVINLCFRFDRSQKNVSTKAFTYIGSIGYLLGTMIYLLTTLFNIHTWPYSLVNYPVMCLFIYLFAYKRGDHLILWHGSFYDFDSSRTPMNVVPEGGEDTQRESNMRLFDGLTLNTSQQSDIRSPHISKFSNNSHSSNIADLNNNNFAQNQRSVPNNIGHNHSLNINHSTSSNDIASKMNSHSNHSGNNLTAKDSFSISKSINNDCINDNN